jgi:predicted secreted protein
VPEIVGKTYRKDEHTRPELKSSDYSGVEYFTFKALQKGEANITFAYKRIGEKEVMKEKIFTILIK